MDLITYALLNKKIKDVEGAGIESITVENGYLIFTMKDGTTQSVEFPSQIVEGYYYEYNFYADEEHTTLITPSQEIIYIDITDTTQALLYRYNGTMYVGTSNAAMTVITSNEELRF